MATFLTFLAQTISFFFTFGQISSRGCVHLPLSRFCKINISRFSWRSVCIYFSLPNSKLFVLYLGLKADVSSCFCHNSILRDHFNQELISIYHYMLGNSRAVQISFSFTVVVLYWSPRWVALHLWWNTSFSCLISYLL